MAKQGGKLLIKFRDPVAASFSSKDIVLNVSTGTIFYKRGRDLFQIRGTPDDFDLVVFPGQTTNQQILINDSSGEKIMAGTDQFRFILASATCGCKNEFHVGAETLTTFSGSVRVGEHLPSSCNLLDAEVNPAFQVFGNIFTTGSIPNANGSAGHPGHITASGTVHSFEDVIADIDLYGTNAYIHDSLIHRGNIDTKLTFTIDTIDLFSDGNSITTITPDRLTVNDPFDLYIPGTNGVPAVSQSTGTSMLVVDDNDGRVYKTGSFSGTTFKLTGQRAGDSAITGNLEVSNLDSSTNVTASNNIKAGNTGSFQHLLIRGATEHPTTSNFTVLTIKNQNVHFTSANALGGGGGSSGTDIAVLNEGSQLVSSAESFDFVGDAVNVTNAGNDITVTIDADTGSLWYDGTPTYISSSNIVLIDRQLGIGNFKDSSLGGNTTLLAHDIHISASTGLTDDIADIGFEGPLSTTSTGGAKAKVSIGLVDAGTTGFFIKEHGGGENVIFIHASGSIAGTLRHTPEALHILNGINSSGLGITPNFNECKNSDVPVVVLDPTVGAITGSVAKLHINTRGEDFNNKFNGLFVGPPMGTLETFSILSGSGLFIQKGSPYVGASFAPRILGREEVGSHESAATVLGSTQIPLTIEGEVCLTTPLEGINNVPGVARYSGMQFHVADDNEFAYSQSNAGLSQSFGGQPPGFANIFGQGKRWITGYPGNDSNLLYNFYNDKMGLFAIEASGRVGIGNFGNEDAPIALLDIRAKSGSDARISLNHVGAASRRKERPYIDFTEPGEFKSEVGLVSDRASSRYTLFKKQHSASLYIESRGVHEEAHFENMPYPFNISGSAVGHFKGANNIQLVIGGDGKQYFGGEPTGELGTAALTVKGISDFRRIGEVGIGIMSPSSSLHVTQSVQADNFRTTDPVNISMSLSNHLIQTASGSNQLTGSSTHFTSMSRGDAIKVQGFGTIVTLEGLYSGSIGSSTASIITSSFNVIGGSGFSGTHKQVKTGDIILITSGSNTSTGSYHTVDTIRKISTGLGSHDQIFFTPAADQDFSQSNAIHRVNPNYYEIHTVKNVHSDTSMSIIDNWEGHTYGSNKGFKENILFQSKTADYNPRFTVFANGDISASGTASFGALNINQSLVQTFKNTGFREGDSEIQGDLNLSELSGIPSNLTASGDVTASGDIIGFTGSFHHVNVESSTTETDLISLKTSNREYNFVESEQQGSFPGLNISRVISGEAIPLINLTGEQKSGSLTIGGDNFNQANPFGGKGVPFGIKNVVDNDVPAVVIKAQNLGLSMGVSKISPDFSNVEAFLSTGTHSGNPENSAITFRVGGATSGSRKLSITGTKVSASVALHASTSEGNFSDVVVYDSTDGRFYTTSSFGLSSGVNTFKGTGHREGDSVITGSLLLIGKAGEEVHLTASGDISASGGDMFAENITIDNNITVGGTISNVNTTHVTASGNISGSGELFFSSSLNDDSNLKTLVYDESTGKVFHTGSYGAGGSGGGLLQTVSNTTGQTGITLQLLSNNLSAVVNGLEQTDDVAFNSIITAGSISAGNPVAGTIGHISASGNISASGLLFASSSTTNALTHIVVQDLITGEFHTFENPGLLSSSLQIASDISGSVGQTSASIAIDITNLSQSIVDTIGNNASNTFKATGQRSGSSGITGSLTLSNDINPALIIKDLTGPESISITQKNVEAVVDLTGGGATKNSLSITTDHRTNHIFVDGDTGDILLGGHIEVKGGGAGANSAANVVATGYIEASGSLIAGNHITSSGNITASGLLFASASEGNFSDLVVYDSTDGRFYTTSSAGLSTGLSTFKQTGVRTGDGFIDGNLTASGNVSASGNLSVTGESFFGSHITSSGNISASGEIITPKINVIQSGITNDGYFINNRRFVSGSTETTLEIGDFDTDGTRIKITDDSNTIELSNDNPNTSKIFIDGEITASGIVSASGNLFADVSDNNDSSFKVLVYDESTGKFFRTGSYGAAGGGGLVTSIDDGTGQTGIDLNLAGGQLSATASGLEITDDVQFNNISASSTIKALDYQIEGKIAINYLAASTKIVFGQTNQNLRLRGKTIELGAATDQHVTASGNISASGLLFASASEGNFSDVVVHDSTTGRFYVTSSAGLSEGLDTFKNTGVRTGDGLIDGNLTASGNISASNISASGTVLGDEFKIAGPGFDLFKVNGTLLTHTNSVILGNSAQFDIHTITGQTEFVGAVTASGNITASGLLFASASEGNFDIATYDPSTGRFYHTSSVGFASSFDTFKATGQRNGDSAITGSLTLSGSDEQLFVHTTNPSPIHIHRTTSNNSNIQYTNNKGTFFAGIDGINAQSDTAFIIGQNQDLSSDAIFIVSGSGTVGINKLAPSPIELHIGPSGGGNGDVVVRLDSGGVSTDDPILQFARSGTNQWSVLTNGTTGGLRFLDVAGGGGDTLYLENSTTNVGINTTSPAAQLHVEGDISSSAEIVGLKHIAKDASLGGFIALQDSSGNNIAALARVGGPPNDDRGRLILRAGGSIQAEFTAGPGPSYIFGAGAAFGIGTPFPGKELEVLGEISASGALFAGLSTQTGLQKLVTYDDSTGELHITSSTAFIGGGGGGGDFDVTADAGTDQTITAGNTLTIAGGTNISTTVGATDTVTINHDAGVLAAGSYGNASNGQKIDNITVDARGHVTAVATGPTGDILGVTAGTGITGGGTSGTVTVQIDYIGTDNFIDGATNLEGTAISTGDTIAYHDATDNTVKKGFISDLPFTNNSGDITSVTFTTDDGNNVIDNAGVASFVLSGSEGIVTSNPSSNIINISTNFALVAQQNNSSLLATDRFVIMDGGVGTKTNTVKLEDVDNDHLTGLNIVDEVEFNFGATFQGQHNGSSKVDDSALGTQKADFNITASNGIAITTSDTGVNGRSIRYAMKGAYTGNFQVLAGTPDGSSTSEAGVIQADGDIIAFMSSDKRLKDNIVPIGSPLKKILKIGGYEFDWNENQDIYKGHDVGIIAQEIEEVLPEIVTTRKNGYKAVKYEKLVPLLIEGIKEQQKQIDELKELVNKLNK